MQRFWVCTAALTLGLGMGAAGLRGQGTQQQTGPVIIPKKAPATPAPLPPPPPPPAQPKFSYSVNVPDVEVPVTVQTKNGQFVPNLSIKQFRVYEDGVEQNIQHVSVTNDAPMTVVELVEFQNADWWSVLYQILEASYVFTGQLQPQDWVALETFDLKPTVVVDFTHDKRAVYAGLNSLHFANFSESDLFDSLSDTIDRLDGVQGHKTIVLIATGRNTFSHMNFDQLRKKLQETQGITIYCVSMAWTMEEFLDANGYAPMAQMSLLQADNELRYIAESTGGRYYQPRFEGAFNDVFRDIAGTVRSQYVISYVPTNRKLDGSVRKVKVDLVAPDGQPLKMVDQKGKTVKYDVTYRSAYTSRHVVE
ncbi:MAG: VWA domain-containing protein [Terriglobales bacterium]